MSEPRSESENPVIPAPTPKPDRPQTNQDWWPNQLNLQVLHQHSPRPTRWARTSTTRRSSRPLDVDALKQDVFEVMTTSQDWWPADYGHYGPLFIRMAWHAAGTYRIADGRGGGGERRAALRPAQQLARQRQPRQGAPAALAGQAEVRPEDLVGRPDRLRRQLRAGVDGVQDVRLRLRAPGRLGARRGLLGPGGHLARRRALQRRAGARRPVRRGADGPDLREPGGARTATPIRSPPPGTSARRSPAWR